MKREFKDIGLVLAMAAAVVALFVGCASASSVPVETLDYKVGTDFPVVKDSQYKESMTDTVVPYLDKIRKVGTIAAAGDGHRVYYEQYDVEGEKGTVVILHGFSEFIAKYNGVIYYFLQEGYDVFMIEHFGHGYSQRADSLNEDLAKIQVKEFDVYTADLKQFLDEVVLPRKGNGGLYLFAHSMGGGIGTRFLEEYPGYFDKAVLTSPMIGVQTNGVPEFLSKFIAGSAVFFGQGDGYVFGHSAWDGNDGDFLNSPGISYPRYLYYNELRRSDDYHQTYGATWSWLKSSLRATTKMVKDASKITIPTILFQADGDTLVRNDRQLKLAQKAPSVHVVFCPDTKHEIFNSPDEIIAPYWSRVFEFLSSNEE